MANISINNVDKETGEMKGKIDLEIRVFPIAEPKGKVKGYASVTVEGLFGAHGISIVEGKNGLFVSMPQTKDAKGEYRDIFHPVTSEGRRALNDAVIAEFGIALDAMATEKESTVQKLREQANVVKGKNVQTPGKDKEPKSKKGGEPEH